MITSLFNILNNANKKSLLTAKIPRSEVFPPLLKQLQKAGLIVSFSCTKQIITVVLKKQTLPKPIHFQNLTKPSCRKTISLAQLKKNLLRNPFELQFLSTNKGFLSNRDAVTKQLGGLALNQIL